MGLGNLFKGQFLSSIMYRASDPQELACLYDREGKKVNTKSILTVQPGQVAIFVNEGVLGDVYAPGRYELTTNNMPITTTLSNWKFAFQDTFIVETVFINTNEIIDIPWGTSEQLTIKDATFGLVNIGANGKYSFCVEDPVKFLEKLVGTKDRYVVEDMKGFMTSQIAMMFKEIVTEKQMDFFDIQSYCSEASEAMKTKLAAFLEPYGIKMNNFNVQIALPENVKKAINDRAALGAMGGIDAYAYKRQVDAQADAMVAMANNPNGGMNSMAGMGMQMSAGMAMASAMGQNMGHPNMMGQQQGMQQQPVQQQPVQQQPVQQEAVPGTAPAFCSQCGTKLTPGAKFCPNCGAKL